MSKIAMQKMAEFCRSHTEIIYGKVKSYKYQEQAEEKQRCHTGLHHAAHQRLSDGAQQALSAGM